MEREELIKIITTEDIISIMQNLGSENYRTDNQGNIYFQTICHGGDNYKLYYYVNSKFFQCFTCCGTMSIFDVIMAVKGTNDFLEAFKYLCNFKNISTSKILKKGLQKSIQNNDLDFLQIYTHQKKEHMINLPRYNKNILKIFDDYLPMSWSKEGIKDDVADRFDIKFYMNQYKAVIPHYDIEGNLVGLKGRSFNQSDIDNGRKYMPMVIQGMTYRYPMQYNLYGLYQNKKNIIETSKVILFESEKSVLLYESYYGQNNNISLALGGMNVSLYQRDLIISLGVEEIVLALDRQYDLNNLDGKEFENYQKTILKIIRYFTNYINISVILDFEGLIDYKSSPIDHGKDTFETLYKNKHDAKEVEDEWVDN